jgi:hypothetical protein
MHRPQDLLQALEVDHFVRLLAVMVRRKTLVRRGMPILRRDDQLELRNEPIRDTHDLVSMRHLERATWAKVVLNIDQK